MRIINKADYYAHTDPLFLKSHVMKMKDLLFELCTELKLAYSQAVYKDLSVLKDKLDFKSLYINRCLYIQSPRGPKKKKIKGYV